MYKPGVKICHLTFILVGLIFVQPIFPLINASEWDKYTFTAYNPVTLNETEGNWQRRGKDRD